MKSSRGIGSHDFDGRTGQFGEGGEVKDDDDDEDELGYYPDGCKRTLTNEQVAMFRHSEIYSIIRAREIQRENEAAAGLDDGAAEASRGSASEEDQNEHPLFRGSNESEMSKLNGSTKINSAGSIQTDNSVPLEAHPGSSSTSKRKRAEIEHLDGPSQKTHRAYVRNLDAMVADNPALNYDGTADTPRLGRDKTSTTSTRNSSSQNVERGDGKKIWWPILQNPE